MSFKKVKDPTYIEEIAQIMKAQGLTRFSIIEDRTHTEVILEMSPPINDPTVHPTVQMPVPVISNNAGSVQSAVFLDAPIDTMDSHLIGHTAAVEEVTAPMVGVFYASSTPNNVPFVHIGDIVRKGDILCTLEAMKVLHEISAECDGKIVEICAKNGDVVELGQVLFKINV
ncbi:MAG: hypothetical protein FWC91_14150 [Defluviitaleaceae bacterium]|nr:hypothetical protein [Defluviitaleaceae bacterium]